MSNSDIVRDLERAAGEARAAARFRRGGGRDDLLRQAELYQRAADEIRRLRAPTKTKG